MNYRYFDAARVGTIIELPDGRRGTTVFNGLSGIGIKWDEHDIPDGAIGGRGDLFDEEVPADYEWMPDAMLREPYENADLPCVGEEFKIIKRLSQEDANKKHV